MAIDQALFESVQDGAPPVLRLYRWDPACLSFGRNQRTLGIYDAMAARVRGIDVVRRPTGGLAVLHDGELTYAVVAPAGLLGGARNGYVAINEALVEAFRALGAPAGIGAGADTAAPSPDALHPCFARPAPGEVVARGRKLVGSAQRVERHTILQHGSILRTGDQAAVTDLQRPAAQAPHGGAVLAAATPGEITLAELLGGAPPWEQLAAAVHRAFAARFGISMRPARLSAPEAARAAELTPWFESDEWTWRR
jgi:lipoate-protein ligase A